MCCSYVGSGWGVWRATVPVGVGVDATDAADQSDVAGAADAADHDPLGDVWCW